MTDRHMTRGRGMGLWILVLAALCVLAAPAPVSRAWAQPDQQPPADEAVEVDEAPAADVDASDVEEGDPLITFSETAEPMELSALVDLVANTLRINVSVRGELRGSVLFNTAQSVRQSKLLPLLDAMLEQHDFSITHDDESGFYLIQPKANIPVVFGTELASTKLIEIPTIKPSALSDAVNQILGSNTGGVSYLDELGLVIITNTPRQIARVEELISQILDRMGEMTLTPIELRYISAPTARNRLISLVGGGAGQSANQAITRQIRRGGDQNQQSSIGPASGATLENLAERLSVDPQSNSLLFRGTPDELDRVMSYISMIDVPNSLASGRHFVGSAARQIAEMASSRGLGEVVLLEDSLNQQSGQLSGSRNFQQQNQLLQNDQQTVAGPTLVVDVRNGEIVYYGTEQQQEMLAEMISTLNTEADRVVIRHYKLNHAVAEEVAEVITALLSGDRGVSQGGLLPQSRGQQNQQQFSGGFGEGGEGEIGEFDPNRVFVVADTPNNQIVVKAPIKQQEDFMQLIERLDLRRRQVYLEALIVSVSDSENFRFAIDAQFKAGQFVTQTNFGLTDVGDALATANLPLPGLGGLTTSLIKNQYLPFVLTAVQNDTDARILSRPQLLVNDNEEATIASIEEQPTTSQSQGNNTTVTSFQGFEEAGTTLTVTPGISEAGFLRLDYEVIFSNFIGAGSDGIPPPRQNQNVTGSVTMPSDSTIVVGGITVNNSRNTVVKVPLLGEIPIIGPLFSDTNKISNNSLLYIFITPKILVDPDFRDLRLITKGPQFDAGVDLNLPALEPVAIDRILTGSNED